MNNWNTVLKTLCAFFVGAIIVMVILIRLDTKHHTIIIRYLDGTTETIQYEGRSPHLNGTGCFYGGNKIERCGVRSYEELNTE